jgi:hypothetical protein
LVNQEIAGRIARLFLDLPVKVATRNGNEMIRIVRRQQPSSIS